MLLINGTFVKKKYVETENVLHLADITSKFSVVTISYLIQTCMSDFKRMAHLVHELMPPPPLQKGEYRMVSISLYSYTLHKCYCKSVAYYPKI
jgi:hypothetical protein